MKLLITGFLLLFTLSLFPNTIITEPEEKKTRAITVDFDYSFKPFETQKKRTKYFLLGFSGDAYQSITTENSNENFTPELSNSIELFLQFERFYYGLSWATQNFKVKNDFLIDESVNETIMEGTQLEYSRISLETGYSVIFKEKFRIIPYYHLGIGDLYSYDYNTGGDESDKELYSNFTTGIGFKAHYIVINTEDTRRVLGFYIPSTIGIVFDAGYNYQFTNSSIPLKGNMGYVSLGLFFGAAVDNYRW